jgi:ribonuclease PH
MRNDGRTPKQLRPIEIIPDYLNKIPSSILIKQGNTWVLCCSSIDHKVPPWLMGQGLGWIAAEYNMLPVSSGSRNIRERVRGISGRTQEIQRLIGRSLRAVCDLSKLGERTIWVDCDVLQADGGTRTTSINGAYIALYKTLSYLTKIGEIDKLPLHDFLGAVSVGIVDGEILLDLTYKEDSIAEVDLNVVMNSHGEFIEVQGGAEEKTFSRKQLDEMLKISEKGIKDIISKQMKAIGLE